MKTIESGSTVSIHYTLAVDGEVVDTSDGGEPLTYVHGSSEIIPGLDAELKGLRKGDKKRVSVPPDKAYGPRDPDAVQTVAKSAFPESEGIDVGDVVRGQVGGRPFEATVQAIEEDSVTLDLNHPLAGKILEFDIDVVDVT